MLDRDVSGFNPISCPVRLMAYSLRLLLLLLIPAVSLADIDIDSDGQSDVLLIDISNGELLEWDVFGSQSSFASASSFSEFGKLGDHLCPANWSVAGEVRACVLSEESGEVHWKILRDGGGVSEQSFGSPRDHLVSGGDYNGNGVADAAYIKRGGKAVIFTDMFASDRSAASQHEKRFSTRVARKGFPLFINRGSGSDELAVLQPKTKGRSSFHLLHLRGVNAGKEVLRFGRIFRKGVSGVLPVEGPDGTDRLAFYRQSSGGVSVQVRDLQGGLVLRKRIKNGTTILVGDYLSGVGQEIGVLKGTTLVVFSPFHDETALLFLGDGVVADHINAVTFKTSSSGGSSGAEGGSKQGSSPSKVCSSVRAVSTGVLYKPASDVNDNRGGKPAVLFTGGFKTGAGSIKVYAGDGTEVCEFTFKASSEPGVNNGADHYYSGWHGGCNKSGSQIASAARAASGNSNVYLQWKGGQCLGPINPTSRNGGI